MEPNEYFKELKTNLKGADLVQFKKQIENIEQQICLANRVGQTNLLHKLVFVREAIFKEQELFVVGIKNYVYKEDMTKYLDSIINKSVKTIELSRYPRPIPIDCLKEIERVKGLNLFDDFIVVYTDFTKEKQQTKEEAAYVARNKDPIDFGIFQHKRSGIKHDRIYFITDWEDEHCDLTFTKLIEKMSKSAYGEIKESHIDLANIVENVKKEMDKKTPYEELEEKQKSIFSRIKRFFRNV
jgi:hypothetical protein